MNEITPDEREIIVSALLNQARVLDKLARAQHSWMTKEFIELSSRTHEEAQKLRHLAEKVSNDGP